MTKEMTASHQEDIPMRYFFYAKKQRSKSGRGDFYDIQHTYVVIIILFL